MVAHRIKGKKLSRPTASRIALIRNLSRELILNERIKTTQQKAKETVQFVEKLVTLGKKTSLHSRRIALSKLSDVKVINKVFDDLAPRYKDRNGGYTRIIKIGFRIGDGASMSLIELV